MGMKILLLLVMVTLMPIVSSKVKRYSKHQTNSLSKARCDLVCLEATKENRSKCRLQCRAQEQKPGTCPASDTPKWEAACIEACNTDSQCDGTQRCCHHTCGSTCSEPLDLLTLPGLPGLPVMDKVKEKRKSVLIHWSDGVGDAARAVPGRTYYLVEEQHHLGPKYEEARLGEWNLLLRTNKTKASLRNLLKPGRWYRFRVAAVSAAGTRGFSIPSAPFTPRKGPRAPPPPKKLKVRPVKTENAQSDTGKRIIFNLIPDGQNDRRTDNETDESTVTIKLEWKEPVSDLPIMRYKVLWSRRVRGVNGELDSVLVNHQTVPKDQTSIEIKDLQPNSMYFLQVQSISQFGLGRLRSDKAAIFYNTTSANSINPNQRENPPPEALKKKGKKIKGLRLHKVIWNNHKIKARISWDPTPGIHEGPERYYVQWRTINCSDPHIPKKDLTAATEETTFEIYELNYRCSYKVNVNRSWKAKTPDSELILNVPRCEHFQQKVNGSKSICET